jgi:LysM repeat protein
MAMGSGRPGVNWNVAILLMVLSVFIGVFLIWAVTYLQNQRERLGTQIVVDGQTITLDPDREVGLFLEEPFEEPAEEVAQPEPTQAVPTPEPTATPVPSPDEIIFIDYWVQQGDTLYRIAHNRIDTNIALMARYNISAKELVVGRRLDLPIGNPAFCPGRRAYAVQEGDTLFSIARRFNTTVTDLQQINPWLDPNATIYVARIICVP